MLNKALLQNAKQIPLSTKNIELFLFEKNEQVTVAELWQSLEKEIADAHFTSRWTWVETWIKYYSDVVDYWFLVAYQKDVPVGITILVKEQHRKLPLPVNAYHVGTEGEPFSEAVQTIHNALLIKDEAKKTFYKVLVEGIMQHFRWEEILFDNFDSKEGDIILKALADKKSFTAEREKCRVMNFDLFTENKNDVLANLGQKTRYSIRKSMRIFDDITTEWAETEEQAEDILCELIELYNKQWAQRGRKGMFASKRFTDFQYEIVKKLLPTKNIILFRVKSKQYGTLGCNYLFLDHGIGYGYQLGINYTNEKISAINKKRLQLGFILHALCMQAALEHGVKIYNFGIGRYSYKEQLTNDGIELMTISLKKGFKPYLRKTIVEAYAKADASKKSPLAIKIVRKLFKK